MLIIEIIVLTGFAYFGARGLLKKKWWKDLAVYIVFFLFGSTLLIIQTLGVHIPYIVDIYDRFLKYTLHIRF